MNEGWYEREMLETSTGNSQHRCSSSPLPPQGLTRRRKLVILKRWKVWKERMTPLTERNEYDERLGLVSESLGVILMAWRAPVHSATPLYTLTYIVSAALILWSYINNSHPTNSYKTEEYLLYMLRCLNSIVLVWTCRRRILRQYTTTKIW